MALPCPAGLSNDVAYCGTFRTCAQREHASNKNHRYQIPARDTAELTRAAAGCKEPWILKSLWRKCRKKEAHKKGGSFSWSRPPPLRAPDQKSCDPKEHQGQAQAFERERNDPGSDDRQAEADHERAPADLGVLLANGLSKMFLTDIACQDPAAPRLDASSVERFRHSPQRRRASLLGFSDDRQDVRDVLICASLERPTAHEPRRALGLPRIKLGTRGLARLARVTQGT